MVMHGSVFSRSLSMETGITVIGPEHMNSKMRVCYVLHGMCGANSDFASYTRLPLYAIDGDTLYVCPEVGRGFYTDTSYGVKYFTYVACELPQITASLFNVSQLRDDTSVIGISMGGYGALKCALAYPERYCFCGAISPAALYLKDYMDELVKTDGDGGYPDVKAVFAGKVYQTGGYDLLTLAREAKDDDKQLPDIYLTCGKEDGFVTDTRRFAADISAVGSRCYYEESAGGHDFMFFDAALEKALTRQKAIRTA